MDQLPRFSRSLRTNLRLDIQRNANYNADQVVVNLWHEENERAKYKCLHTISFLCSMLTFFFLRLAEPFHGRSSKQWYSKNLLTTKIN